MKDQPQVPSPTAPMTPEQRDIFAWITKCAANCAPLFHHKKSESRGTQLINHLWQEYEAAFPKEEITRRAQRDAAAAQAKTNAERLRAEGPKLWAELHGHTLLPVTNPLAEMMWLKGFASRLNCGDCRAFYTEYLKEAPPDFKDYFAWSHGLHNAVNAKLGKPSITIEDARAIQDRS